VFIRCGGGYFDSVIAGGGADAASIEFPSHCPQRRFELKGPQMRIGRRSVYNGTLVNGREIESGKPVPLHDGDRVCLGAWTALTFHANVTRGGER